MFTGIVEELGTVQNIQSQGNTMILTIEGNIVLDDLKIGHSIAVNGVCLTVTKIIDHFFIVDVMPETYRSTSLANLTKGARVNLERAMSATGRFGGHFVTGHVDDIGKIIRKETSENAILIDVSIPEKYSHLLLYKGSIALDGISLTIFDAKPNQITVSIIPHTAKETVLGLKKVGDIINLEFDMIGKYLYSFLEKNKQANTISAEFLKENGFI